MEYQIECAQKVVDHHKAMVDSISERSPFLAELEERYTTDTKYEVSAIIHKVFLAPIIFYIPHILTSI